MFMYLLVISFLFFLSIEPLDQGWLFMYVRKVIQVCRKTVALLYIYIYVQVMCFYAGSQIYDNVSF